MIELDNNEMLNLYYFLCDQENLSDPLDILLNRLELLLFRQYSVIQIEENRKEYRNKGKV